MAGAWADMRNELARAHRNCIGSRLVNRLMSRLDSVRLPPLLVADDDENDLFFFEHRLRQGGVRNPILHFPDGLVTIGYLETIICTPPALRPALAKILFLDIKMPRRSGFEVLEWARNQNELDWLPIVLLSGSGLAADIQRAARLGADRYLVKYPPADELAAAVESAGTSR